MVERFCLCFLLSLFEGEYAFHGRHRSFWAEWPDISRGTCRFPACHPSQPCLLGFSAPSYFCRSLAAFGHRRLNNLAQSFLPLIIKNAGNRVQLYEFGNEPDHYCKMTGTTYGQKWNETV